MQLAREGSPPPRLRPPQAELSRKSNQIARGRIRRFESDMPSHAVGFFVRYVRPPKGSSNDAQDTIVPLDGSADGRRDNGAAELHLMFGRRKLKGGDIGRNQGLPDQSCSRCRPREFRNAELALACRRSRKSGMLLASSAQPPIRAPTRPAAGHSAPRLGILRGSQASESRF
jgi:hypothetical protein